MDDKKIDRREAIAKIGVASAVLAFGCGGESNPIGPATTAAGTTTPTTGGGTNAACAVTPSETDGP